MIVEYTMKTKYDTINFKSVGKINNNTLEFKDTILKNNNFVISFFESKINIKRIGKIKMNIDFILNKRCKGTYTNEMNLSFDMESYTKKLIIDKNYIEVEYDSYIANEFNGTNKLIIKY